MQSTWANDFDNGAGGCEISHPIVTNPAPPDTVTVTNPGTQTGTAGVPASLQDVYGVAELAALALAGLVIALAGAVAPATWAARARTASALRAE